MITNHGMLAKLLNIVASKTFFCCVVGLFVVQAVWIALSGGYPLAFDEDFHFGIIRLYAHHILPFWTNQPPNADIYGPVYRDPSYLYQYLMSFPYRLINVFTHDTTIQVIILRLINVGLFASALILYRRLLLRLGASKAVAHTILGLFVLIPIVPFLAAQINYDNLFLPLTALFLLLALSVHDDIRKARSLRPSRLSWLVAIGLLTSLVKYPFLPILLATTVFLSIEAYRYLGKRRKFWQSVGRGFGALSRTRRWLFIGLLIVSVGLFCERYLIDVARYHKIVPACDQVLSVERCKSYGPWNRDYNFAVLKSDQHDNAFTYTADWVYGMWFRTFFAVDGPATNFETRGPLVIPAMSAVAFAGIGFIAFLAFLPRIVRRHGKARLAFSGLVVFMYALVLWVDNFQAYIRTGQPVAISGRYLLVIYPLVMLLLAFGYKELLRGKPRIQIFLAALAVACFSWGGGTLTYILRSRDEWLWPSPIVRHVNYDVRQWIAPVVPGSHSPIEFLP